MKFKNNHVSKKGITRRSLLIVFYKSLYSRLTLVMRFLDGFSNSVYIVGFAFLE